MVMVSPSRVYVLISELPGSHCRLEFKAPGSSVETNSIFPENGVGDTDNAGKDFED
jgi:hypothetical protein